MAKKPKIKSITNFWIETFLALTGLVQAVITLYITITPRWARNNDYATEFSVMYGSQGAGIFNRCWSRFGNEFTCDDWIEPFWTLPAPIIIARVFIILANVFIYLHLPILVLSMTCVLYAEMSPGLKQSLNCFAWWLRFLSCFFLLITTVTYGVAVSLFDIRWRINAANSAPAGVLAASYVVYQLWDKCLYLGFAFGFTDLIILTYWAFMILLPEKMGCQEKYVIGFTKMPEYYLDQQMKEEAKLKMYQENKNKDWRENPELSKFIPPAGTNRGFSSKRMYKKLASYSPKRFSKKR